MSEEGTGNQVKDGDLLPGMNLKSAAAAIADARARLELRESVGKALRGAIQHILEAQDKLEGAGTIPEMRLDLLEAMRFIGAVESAFKDAGYEAATEMQSGRLSPRESSPEVPSRLASSPSDSPAEVDPTPSDVAVPEADTRAAQQAPDGTTGSLNRRSFNRLAAAYPIQMQAPYDGSGTSDLTRLPISGVTVNLSRGGMLAQIDQGILRQGRYLIRFLGAGQNVRPEIMWARVLRSRAADSGWEVGVEFDSPLEILKP